MAACYPRLVFLMAKTLLKLGQKLCCARNQDHYVSVQQVEYTFVLTGKVLLLNFTLEELQRNEK